MLLRAFTQQQILPILESIADIHRPTRNLSKREHVSSIHPPIDVLKVCIGGKTPFFRLLSATTDEVTAWMTDAGQSTQQHAQAQCKASSIPVVYVTNWHESSSGSFDEANLSLLVWGYGTVLQTDHFGRLLIVRRCEVEQRSLIGQ